jgi:hypothetical protein
MLKIAFALVYDVGVDCFSGMDHPKGDSMFEGEERRSTRRSPVTESLIATAAFPTKPDLRLQVTNLSIGGFCFETETDISGESRFDISLKAVEGGETLLRLESQVRVIWHISDEATSLHVGGAEFVDLPESGRESLARFLDLMKPKE